MKNIELLNLELHKKAEDTLVQLTDEYATSVLYEAKILAFKTKQDQVQSVHINQAADNIIKKKTSTWVSELLKIIGSALLGIFIPGFITTVTAATVSKILLVIYIGSGFIGIIMLFIGLRKN